MQTHQQEWFVIGHQLNNSLSVIRTNTELLKMSLNLNTKQKQVIERIIEGSKSAVKYLSDLKLVWSLSDDTYDEEHVLIELDELLSNYKSLIANHKGQYKKFVGHKYLYVRLLNEIFDNAFSYCLNESSIALDIESGQFYTRFVLSNDTDPKHMINTNKIVELGVRGYNASFKAGKGMGLSIVKAIVKYLKGDMDIAYDYKGRFSLSIVLPKDFG